jgi:hypothetical protein
MKLPKEYRFSGAIGEQQNFNCPSCNDTRGRLYVKKVAGGYLTHCHNCAPKMSGFTPSGELLTPREMREVIEKHKEYQVVAPSEIALPRDFTPVIPPPGLAWLYKYGITDGEILQYRFGYSPYLRRLVMPVFDRVDALIFWQGRILDVGQPKYINVRSSGRDVYFQSRSKPCVSAVGSMESRRDSRVCLVEDILSGVKVGRVCNTIALLGSYIPDSLIRNLISYGEIIIYLDEDKLASALKYQRRIALLTGGKKVRVVSTKLDPKEQSMEEIRNVLNIS